MLIKHNWEGISDTLKIIIFLSMIPVTMETHGGLTNNGKTIMSRQQTSMMVPSILLQQVVQPLVTTQRQTHMSEPWAEANFIFINYQRHATDTSDEGLTFWHLHSGQKARKSQVHEKIFISKLQQQDFM